MPRLHSTSGGFSDSEAKELQVSPYGRPSADIAVTIVTPVANVPSALRKSRGSIAELSLASSLAGSAGCLGKSDIQPASKRQILGRQAKRYPSVVGPRSIEIECEVRVHGVRIAELTLQRSRSEQAAGAACRKQKRHGIGAQIDRERTVAPQFRLLRNVRNIATPGFRKYLNAVGAHDQARGIYLCRCLGDLDLCALQVADLGPIVCGGAMSCDLDVVVKARLGIAQPHPRQRVWKQREHRECVERIWIDDAAWRWIARQVLNGNRHVLGYKCIRYLDIVRSGPAQSYRIPRIVDAVISPVQ